MKVKGCPLRCEFNHVEYVDGNGTTVHKTYAKCFVDAWNVPDLIYSTFFSMFANEMSKYGDRVVTLYSSTVCKNGDTYDPKTGERIARKKIMKQYMSMVRQAAIKQLEINVIENATLADLADGADNCRNKIIEYLENQ
jgi:hypothetical protein